MYYFKAANLLTNRSLSKINPYISLKDLCSAAIF